MVMGHGFGLRRLEYSSQIAKTLMEEAEDAKAQEHRWQRWRGGGRRRGRKVAGHFIRTRYARTQHEHPTQKQNATRIVVTQTSRPSFAPHI